ncbi:MAG: hypothetical protein AAGK37_14225 [Pseudomonadota bacterium]
MEILGHGLDLSAIQKTEPIMPNHWLTTVDDRNMPDVCLQLLVAITLLNGVAKTEDSQDKASMFEPLDLAMRTKTNTIPPRELAIATSARRATIKINSDNASIDVKDALANSDCSF